MPYLTPETAAGVTLCRRLRFDAALAGIVTGALELLTHSYAWEQNLPGDLTPDEAVALAMEMFSGYLDGGDICMIGTIIAYATVGPPTGVLECNGATYDRVDYPSLYAALDGFWKIDADTFKVPDLRGRVVVGVGNGVGLTNRTMGEIGGEETHQLTVSEIPSHSHFEQDPGSVVVQAGVPEVALADPGLPSQTGDTGGDQPHENMPPWLGLRYGIIAQ